MDNMSSRKDKLHLLLRQHKQEEAESKELLTKANRMISHKKNQIDLLEAHKLTMKQKYAKVNIPVLMNNLHSFVAKIDEAITEENKKILVLETQCQDYKKTYMTFHKKVESIEKKIAEMDADESIEIDKMEQKELDSLIQNQFLPEGDH